MDNLKVNPVSFKAGNYLIKGQADVLDEICWYLKKKKGHQELGFDFLDLRIAKDSSSRMRESSDLFGLDFPSESFATENVDLFLTQEDKKIAESKMTNMIEDSLESVYGTISFKEKAKILLDNLAQAGEYLSKGKPIINIRPSIILEHLGILNIPQLKPLSAEDVFNGIRQGKFDIINGKFLN